ncbi:tetratricopeptide repeat-containing glycosyltransferase family 2 protein [Cohnella candidum]|uniref:Glycosyltransferase n=1 Tax=Cohnella candidum TaxID=2674991 RepID=A0A3G3K1U1_9BACL|nr:TPR domain-containing glycosyltransferase [Cohnella candidum]AYQ74131.1 glycosyltransferase [Cohnella candidum]
MQPPFLGLCMIVRNEGDLLEKCLSSTASSVDEIVIIDTGSTDSTKSIASRYTQHVYDFDWNDDFAAARNAAIERSTSTWILMLDADEYLDVPDLAELRKFLSTIPVSDPSGLVLPVYNFVGTTGSGKISESKAMRVFTRHPDLRFDRPIHEQLVSRSGRLKELEYPLIIYHTGYTTETIAYKRKNERNQAILNAMRQEGRFTPYDSFLMGNECYSQDRYEEAILHYREANQASERNKSWLPLCIGNLVNCLMKIEQFTDAYVHIIEAKRAWPEACDFYWLEGYLLAQTGFDEQAIGVLQECLRRANRKSGGQNWLISPNYGSTLPLQQLAVLHLRRFAFQEAVGNLTQLAFAVPNHLAVLVQLLKLIRTEEPERIASLLNSIYPDPGPEQKEMIGQACDQAGLASLAGQFGYSGNGANRDTAESDLTSIAETCMRLFRSGEYDRFDEIVQKQGERTLELAQLLGDAMFEDRQFEIALDYYSLLLQKNSLSGKGYENLARLYLAQGDVEEGLEFAEQALVQLPDRIELYTLLIQYLDRTSPKRDEILSLLFARFPGMLRFPLLPQ